MPYVFATANPNIDTSALFAHVYKRSEGCVVELRKECQGESLPRYAQIRDAELDFDYFRLDQETQPISIYWMD
jgi:hypothetical protein